MRLLLYFAVFQSVLADALTPYNQSMETFGTKLRRFRMSKRLSQAEVSNAIPIHQTTYSDWESDSVSPKLNHVIRLAEVLETPSWLFLDGTSVQQIHEIIQENKLLRQENRNLRNKLNGLGNNESKWGGKWLIVR